MNDNISHRNDNENSVSTMGTASNCYKLRLLMWKNFLLQRRKIWGSIFEILFPVLFVGILFLVQGWFASNFKPSATNATSYTPFSVDTLDSLRKLRNVNESIRTWKLAYLPKNAVFDDIMDDVTKSLALDGFISVQSAKDLGNVLFSQQLVAGIEFHHPASISEMPKQLSYSLRFPNDLRAGWGTWMTDRLQSDISEIIGSSRDTADNDGAAPHYFREGFVPIQNAIARAIVKLKSANLMPPTVLLQRLPIPSTTETIQTVFLKAANSLLLAVLIAFAYICVNAVRAIVTEKESQLCEMMKIMGLSSSLQWASWFVRTMTSMTISITLIVILLSLRIYTESNWLLMWMVFFIYGISVTTFSFAVSAFFSKATWAYYAATFLWSGSIIPYFFVAFEDLTYTKQLLICLSPNIAMLYATQHITNLEILGDGLQWSNIWHSGLYDDNLTIGIIVLLMLLTSIVLFLITLYVERVLPGTYGMAQPWYFPFSRVFWHGDAPQRYIQISEGDDIKLTNFEKVPKNAQIPVGIHIKNLTKVFSDGKVAVNNCSVDMFENQITVLLGQNGAGKSTTISMLTGMLPSTSGTALINGFDIRSETKKARSSFGLCAQNNILFDVLTVREHILFYSTLKGLDSQSAEREVTKYTNLLNLEPDKRASGLSGGMKRKLSLANALCGGSKFVMCDEPSSGMDPQARRELWKVLQDEKRSRTILLTTHYMDEADILGDRIAIMAEGRLKCCGSSFFLKKRFGAGYHLVCVKEDGCDSGQVTELLSKYLPNISIATDIGTELSYHLPDDDTSFFQQMFSDLENNMKSLRLSSFGVSLTTLEDVFHKIGTAGIGIGDKTNDTTDTDSLTESSNRNIVLLRGLALIRNQWYAMFKKKYFYWKRNWILYTILNVVAIAAMAYAGYAYNSPTEDSLPIPSLPISLATYAKSETILDEKNANGSDISTSKIMAEYKNEFNAQTDNAKLAITKLEDMETYFLELAKSNLATANRKNLAGVTFNKFGNSTIIAWFNGHPYHAAPLTLNLVHNAIIKAMIGTDHSIQLYNHPLPNTTANSEDHSASENRSGEGFFSHIGLLLALISANYIMSYIKEQESKSKLLQLLSGVNVFIFWATSFFWDLFTFVITISLIIATVAPFQIHNWSSPGELGLVFIVLFAFGFAMLPMNYVFSLLFKSPSTGLQVMITINFMMGHFASAVFPILKPIINKAWEWMFLAFPHYACIQSFTNLDVGGLLKDKCVEKCEMTPDCNLEICSRNYFAWEQPGIGRNLACMFGTSIFYFAILSLYEYQIIQKMCFSIYNFLCLKFAKIPSSEEVDADVLAEKQRVNELLFSSAENTSSNLILQNLTSLYGRFVAVNRLSLAIEPLECFGLLGVNGAGKTTTFKMLTGDKCISEGDAWVCNVSVKNDLTRVYKIVAYCPQFDALLDDLTGRETLEVFGMLHGIPRTDIAAISHAMATKFDFIKYVDKKVSEFSGGNKRKLSTAIAFLGNPSVVYLDEPTAGMDPSAKRKIWDIISQERSSGKTIVLTTHSMDECEALCSRVAIMVRGEFKCLGSMQHLKNKFSQGYELTVKVRKATEQDDAMNEAKKKEIMEYITGNFPGAILKETYQELLTYYVPPSNETQWSQMFGLIESAKRALPIEDYSIKQTSLEQVFIAMAKL